MSRAIFVSYRRDDAAGEAGRLYDDLARAFAADCVFIDVAGIAPGVDFRRAIDENVAACGVFLAIIGPRWTLSADAKGSSRLDYPSDFVRLEIASALARSIPVIPILVRGASMPSSDQLPENLRDLAYRNAVELSQTRWNFDVEQLVRALRPYVHEQPPAPRAKAGLPSVEAPQIAPSPAKGSPFTRKQLALAAALCLLVAIYPLYHILSRPRTSVPASTPQPSASQSSPPELPFRKGPPLVAGDIDGTWTSQAPTPESFANKIVISGPRRYRTLYVLGKCGNDPCEWTTPDADFANGKLTYINEDGDAKNYLTMYLTSRGLFMHAEKYSPQASPGTPREEEVGYYDNASDPRYVPVPVPARVVAAPKLPYSSGPPQTGGDITGTWAPIAPETSGLAFKIVIDGEGAKRSLYIEGQMDKKRFTDGEHGTAVMMDGKLTAAPTIGGLMGTRQCKIYYTIYPTAKGLFVHAERYLDPPQPGPAAAIETQDGFYRKLPASQNEL